MADITLKNLGDLPVVEPNESTHLLAEQDGAYTRVPKDKVGGGVTSWNDLTDKPFSEEKVVIEWDGVVGDKVFAENANSGVKLVKVSDAVIPAESLGGARVAFRSTSPEMPGEEMILSEGTWQVVGGVTVAATGLLFVVEAPEQNKYPILGVSVNITFTEPGLYFVLANMGGAELWCSLFEMSTVKTIDPKFVPSNAFHVRFEYDESNNFVASCTGAEILDAIDQGKTIVAKYYNGDWGEVMANLGWVGNNGPGGIGFARYMLSGNGLWLIYYCLETDTNIANESQFLIGEAAT